MKMFMSKVNDNCLLKWASGFSVTVNDYRAVGVHMLLGDF